MLAHATLSSLTIRRADFLDEWHAAIWTLLSSLAAAFVAVAAIVYGVWWLAAAMIVRGVIAAIIGVRDLRRAVRSTQAR